MAKGLVFLICLEIFNCATALHLSGLLLNPEVLKVPSYEHKNGNDYIDYNTDQDIRQMVLVDLPKCNISEEIKSDNIDFEIDQLIETKIINQEDFELDYFVENNDLQESYVNRLKRELNFIGSNEYDLTRIALGFTKKHVYSIQG